jgi:hypothetical protein
LESTKGEGHHPHFVYERNHDNGPDSNCFPFRQLKSWFGAKYGLQRLPNPAHEAEADHRAAAPRSAMAAFMDSMETIFLAGSNIPLSTVTSLVAATNS